jgi:hypothetical protein
LNLGFSNYSNNFLRRLRLTSRIDVGILGPASLGSAVQKTIHDIEPVGWQNQITNSFVANYFIQVEKGSRISKNLEILGRVSGNLGTLYDNLAAGASIRLYNSSSYFESLVIMPYPENQKHRFNYFVMFSAEGRAILYDATLQGGLFRQESEIYTLQTDQVNRAVFQAKLNAGISYRWVQLDVEHVFLTQEFKTGKNHMWSRIKATFRLRE